jgi:hypothetical protein
VELLCPLLDAGVGWLTLRFRCATGRANYFFIIVVVIRYDTAASTRWTLVFIVRAFINYTITVTVWTRFGFHGASYCFKVGISTLDYTRVSAGAHLCPSNGPVGPSTLLSTIFRASSNAAAGVKNDIVAASLSPSSSYIVTITDALCLTIAQLGPRLGQQRVSSSLTCQPVR